MATFTTGPNGFNMQQLGTTEATFWTAGVSTITTTFAGGKTVVFSGANLDTEGGAGWYAGAANQVQEMTGATADFTITNVSLAQTPGYLYAYGTYQSSSGYGYGGSSPTAPTPLTMAGLVTYLFTGHDTYIGSAATDTLVGQGGNDTFVGGSGTETFVPAAIGSNTITGGGGVDTVVYASAHSAYSVSESNNTVSVKTPNGTDTLTNVDDIKFSDETVFVAAKDHAIAGTGASSVALFQGNEANYTIVSTGAGSFTITDNVAGQDGTTTVSNVGSLQFADKSMSAQNQAPVVAAQTGTQVWVEGQNASFTLPAGTFTDPLGESLTYSATLAGGQALPSWLTFNPATGTFSGTVPTAVQTLDLQVTATNTSGLAVSETFDAQITTATVAAFASLENSNGRGASGIATFVPNASGSATVDGVVGFQSMTFTGGNDAVILNGPRSQYVIQVGPSDNTQITDSSDNQTITVSGESYILFDGGNVVTTNGSSHYQQIYLALTPTDVQVAEIYAAALARMPDLPGLEFWENQVANGMSLNSLAAAFVTSSEFAKLFPAAAAASDHGGPNDSAFVTQLYETVLGRAPDAAGEAYWVSQFADGTLTRAAALVDFALSTENKLNIYALNSGSGWLIDYGNTGGYADSGNQTEASVLGNAAVSHFVNTTLITPTGLTNVTVGGLTITSAGALTDSNSGDIIVLSSAISTATVTGQGNLIIGPSGGGATINDNGASTSIRLSGTGNVINYGPGESVSGYVAGSDHLSSSTTVPNLYAPTTTAMLNGHNLVQGENNIVYIGNVGGGSTAEAASAANAVFTPADMANETVTFYGQSGSNTVFFKWVNPSSMPTATVMAAELTSEVSLAGVTATALTLTDFHV
jgi:hypothetical protein